MSTQVEVTRKQARVTLNAEIRRLDDLRSPVIEKQKKTPGRPTKEKNAKGQPRKVGRPKKPNKPDITAEDRRDGFNAGGLRPLSIIDSDSD